MKRTILIARLAVLLIAGVLSFGAHARDSSDGGCTESDGTWVCTGDPITVIGEPIDTDSFNCRKNPLNCVPVPPPTRPRPGGASDGGNVGAGYEGAIKETEQVTAAALRAMDCAELRDLEKAYKVHVEFARIALESHRQSLRDAESRLADADFSAAQLGLMQDMTNLSCGLYELTRNRRLAGPKECTERPGKPPICRVPPPSRVELQQAISCRDNSRDLNARRADQLEWMRRRDVAQAGVLAMTGNLRYVQTTLNRIQTEAARKNCPP